ncbi:hypothetical protein I316_07995 [Kwoniella heveanensis BCC8398]|uniref:Amidase domain-containing protein n=1 Tax=Kwoniella heveanensis BCC8398 TaxID=1296120 RepID=A0A1B9GHD3_9TREE|nr:hypothetical protein I316_07995 [Kwoniella heveanensis BCC8398]
MLVPLSSILPLLLALATASPALARGFVGNEDYAAQSRNLLRSSMARRDGGISSQVASVSFTLGQGDMAKDYLSPISSNHKSYTVTSDWGLDSLVGVTTPVTVLTVDGEVTCDVLGKKVSEFMAVDDVFDTIPQGPYYATIGSSGAVLTEIYRLYKDEAQALTTAVIPTVDGGFTALSANVPGLNTLSIPVPSRVYTAYLDNPRPLEGRRIAVKDLYDLAGIHTGGGNRAYQNIYPPRTATAFSMQRLIDQGGIIVARAKTSTFANGETATADWVDQMCPFNPRGDGYQQPSSSSSGPGAAIAAYDWLDNTIGSDTGCSIICPAGAQGVFGMRPTHGAIDLTGVIPMMPDMDTAGFFSRDAVKGRDFSKGWYGDRFGNYTSLPKTLKFPNGSWSGFDGIAAGPILEKFRADLLDFVRPQTVDTRSDYESVWNETGYYEAAGNRNISVYMGGNWGGLVYHWQWFNFGAPFFEDYQAANDGRNPFVAPSPAGRWAFGRTNITEEMYQDFHRRKDTYQQFITKHVLTHDNDTCTNAIIVSPSTTGSTNYRNIYRQAPSPNIGTTAGEGVDPFASGTPELIIPIGQVPYESNITNHTEYLPVTVALQAARDCDYVLWDLAAALQEAGVISAVSTGRTGFPVV